MAWYTFDCGKGSCALVGRLWRVHGSGLEHHSKSRHAFLILSLMPATYMYERKATGGFSVSSSSLLLGSLGARHAVADHMKARG